MTGSPCYYSLVWVSSVFGEWRQLVRPELYRRRTGVRDMPGHIRFLTLEGARKLHTFTEGKSATYRQIGDAVPCGLTHAIARTAIDVLNRKSIEEVAPTQLSPSLAISWAD
jgi:hypothetical protein